MQLTKNPRFNKFPWVEETKMENQKKVVVCPENEELAAYMWDKMQEMAQTPKGISDNISKTLQKAYTNLCKSKTPIKTLKQFSEIKGVGKWLLRLMKGFFQADDRGSSSSEETDDSTEKGKRNKGTKRYMPQKNSVAYALLITLYRSLLMLLTLVVFLVHLLDLRKAKEKLYNLAHQGTGTADGAAWGN